jgi:hypothetical protein
MLQLNFVQLPYFMFELHNFLHSNNVFMTHPQAPQFLHSIVNPKVEITEGERVRVRSLVHNISRVEGCVGALGWGLG